MPCNMDHGNHNHQEADLAVYGAEVGMNMAIKPYDRSRDSTDCNKQKKPPKNARGSTPVFREA